MSGERILNFKSARGLGKNILQKETRIFLVWLKYQKWKYVIDLRLLRVSRALRFPWFIRSRAIQWKYMLPNATGDIENA